jgi:hypothetical protein
METTILGIAAVVCIVVAAISLWYSFKVRILMEDYESKLPDLVSREKALQKRHNDLDLWERQIKEQVRHQSEWLDQRKHIYANFEVLDSEENKPTAKSIGKSLSSKIGYALRREFPDIQERHDDAKGGRTVYSVDFYVTKFEQ